MGYRVFFFCVIILLIHGSEIEEDNGLLVLDERNFESAISKSEFTLVMFYAPWCGHCKTLMPEFQLAAEQAKKKIGTLNFAKVDATLERELGSRFEIHGYPTLKFFAQGSVQEYNGGRTSQEILAWVMRRIEPASMEVQTPEEIDQLLAHNDVLMLFLMNNVDELGLEVFKTVARQYEPILFRHSTKQKLLKHFAVNRNSIIMLKTFDEQRKDCNCEVNEAILKNFIDSNQHPTLNQINVKSTNRIFYELNPALVLFINENDASSKQAEEALDKILDKFKGKIILSKTPINFPLAERLAVFMGVKKENLPTARIIHPITRENIKKYSLQGEINKDSLLKFLEDWKGSKLKPYYKSQEIPVSNEGPLKVAVGSTFSSLVYDSKTDVFVLFYAPWCSHCAKVIPEFEKLANMISERGSGSEISIIKMDATENEVEGLLITSFPTILLFPKSSKKNHIDYRGDQTYENFLKFLREHSSIRVYEGKKIDL